MKLKWLFTIWVLINFNVVSAQQNKISEAKILQIENSLSSIIGMDSSTVFSKTDSIIQSATKSQNFLVLSLTQLSLSIYYYKEFDDLNSYDALEKAEKFARFIKNPLVQIKIGHQKALLAVEKSSFLAKKQLDELLLQTRKYNYRNEEFAILSSIGLVYELEKKPYQAQYVYKRALFIAKSIKSKEITKLYFNLSKNAAKLYGIFSNQSIYFAQKSYSSARLSGNWKQASVLAYKLGLIANNSGNVGKRKEFFQESIQFAMRTKSNDFISACYNRLALWELENGSYDTYLGYSKQSLELAKVSNTRAYLNYLIIYLTEDKRISHKQKGKLYDEMITTTRKYCVLDNVIVRAYFVLGELNLKAQPKIANKFLIRHLDLQRKLNAKEEMLNKKGFDLLIAEEEIKKLERKIQSNKNISEYKSKSSRRAIIIWSIAIVFLITLIYVFNFYINKVKSKNNFNRQLIRSVDDERYRISKDLHDNIGQMLSLLKIKIDLMAMGKSLSIADLTVDVRNIINETRNISKNIFPENLQRMTLVENIQNLFKQIEETTNIHCSISTDFNEQEEIFTKEEKNQLYRVLQECTNNTLKHSNATLIQVKIFNGENEKIIKYTDNGVGLRNVDSKYSGIGMRVMRSRMRQLKGKFKIVPVAQGVYFEFAIKK